MDPLLLWFGIWTAEKHLPDPAGVASGLTRNIFSRAG